MKHIQVASCTTTAFGVASKTLLRHSKELEVVKLPLYPNLFGFSSIETMIRTAIASTQILLEIDSSAPLSIAVMREWISEKMESPGFARTYSVGFVVTCCRQGVLALFYDKDWAPADKRSGLDSAVSAVFDELQSAMRTPEIGIIEISTLLGQNLMNTIEFPVEQTLHRIQ